LSHVNLTGNLNGGSKIPNLKKLAVDVCYQLVEHSAEKGSGLVRM
jgi:hypothetical protein